MMKFAGKASADLGFGEIRIGCWEVDASILIRITSVAFFALLRTSLVTSPGPPSGRGKRSEQVSTSCNEKQDKALAYALFFAAPG